MSTSPIAAVGPAWNRYPVMVFGGQFDTHIKTGEDYETLPLASIFTMEPEAKAKGESMAFIPSRYNDFDGREHAVQRANGEFIALCGDIDKGDHDIARIESLIRGFAQDCAWLIYSSAHARSGDMRWRVIMPLAEPVPFDDWHDAQNAFFNFMEAGGITMDRALDRAAQPVYLPNVPAKHAKTDEALRDGWNDPLYYKRATTGTNAPGLRLDKGAVQAGIATIRRKREADDKAREQMRRSAEARKAMRPQGDGVSVMEEFNRSNSIANLLQHYGYQQSPRNGDDWHSPHQEGDSYATRIMGDKWVSLSMSDAAAGLGETCKSGCFGDAYDLFVHYEHKGNHKAAHRQLHAERKAGMPQPDRYTYAAELEPEYDLETGEPIMDMPEYDYENDGDVKVQRAETEAEKPLVKATPFVWRETSDIPKRQWLYGKHLLRKFVSVDVAAGGVGKSSLKIGEALAMASGRDLYEKGLPEGALTVWLWNLEDPLDEIERRVHATMQRFKITPSELGDRFYADSGRDQPLVMAIEGPDGAKIVRPVVDALISEMNERKIDVLAIDPFVSSHTVSENDNNAIDVVAREWNMVAERTGAAINLVHHVRKGNGVEATADSARGASSLIGKARSVLVYNRMSEDEAAKLNVPSSERFFYFRTDNDKANLAPPERGVWYRMNNVDLDNGDSVGVACSWSPPDAFDGLTSRHLYMVQKAISEGKWRENIQTKDAWVGNAVAAVLELNIDEKHARKRVQMLLETWIREGALEVVEEEVGHRKTAKFVVVNKWATL